MCFKSWRADLGSYYARWNKGQKVSDIVLTWVVLRNILRTHQTRVVRAPTPPDELAAIIYVADENCRNPLKEAKH